MAVPVLTAVGHAGWESDLVAGLARGEQGVVVVRRCVDLADLLATAATGQARVALLSSDLRRLDRDALARLLATGTAVVGIAPAGDDEAERRLRQMGVARVLPADAPLEAVCAAVLAAVAGPPDTALVADPLAAAPPLVDAPLPRQGRVVAVWGPTGAPGRTTVAVGLAAEVAALDRAALLVDADVYGGVVAQVLGLLDESPGLAAACRAANAGTLDLPALAALARRTSPRLTVLSGIARADRWPELRPAALEAVLDLCRGLAEVTVVDCGFALEQDEELAYDTLAPRRNGATLQVLEQADTVLAVGSADPVGVHRLVRGLAELREAVPTCAPRVVVNRLRGGAVPDAERQVREALSRYAGVHDVAVLPYDQAALDAALATGRTLPEVAPGSAVRTALRALAADLVGVPASPLRRRWSLRR